MKKILCSVIPPMLCLIQYCYGQDSLNSISLRYIHGLKNFSTYVDPLKGTSTGVEIAYQISMSRNAASWVKAINAKDVSFSFSYINMQHVSVSGTPTQENLGSSYGAVVSVDMAVWNRGATTIMVSPGMGVAYNTQTFYTNGNLIVGSHINVVTRVGASVQTPLSSGVMLQVGVMASHGSNASWQPPNNSVNIFSPFVGVSANVDAVGPASHKVSFEVNDVNSFDLAIGAGKRGLTKTGIVLNPIPGQPNYFLTDEEAQKKTPSDLYQIGMYAGYNRRINSLISLKVGTDIVYYTHPFSWQNFYNTYQGNGSSYDHESVGVSVGSDLWLGRFALTANYGYFVHYNSLYPVHFYATLGGKYYLTRSLALNGKLYMERAEPQNASFGLLVTVK